MLDTVLCSCGSGLRRIRCCDVDPAALPEPVSFELLNGGGGRGDAVVQREKNR